VAVEAYFPATQSSQLCGLHLNHDQRTMGSSRFGNTAPMLGEVLPQHCEIVRDGFGRVRVGGQA
jgi:hypothetical protein